jgi:hypothetical protein
MMDATRLNVTSEEAAHEMGSAVAADLGKTGLNADELSFQAAFLTAVDYLAPLLCDCGRAEALERFIQAWRHQRPHGVAALL